MRLFKTKPNIEKWGKIVASFRAGKKPDDLSKADKEIIAVWNAFLKYALRESIVIPNELRPKYYMASFEWTMKNEPSYKRRLQKCLEYYSNMKKGEVAPINIKNELIELYRMVNTFAQLLGAITDNT